MVVKWPQKINFSVASCSGWRLDGVGQVVRLWDGVHTLAQPRVPGSAPQERREALQRQHDGEQKLHGGTVCAL